jgi:hypothetical protein
MLEADAEAANKSEASENNQASNCYSMLRATDGKTLDCEIWTKFDLSLVKGSGVLRFVAPEPKKSSSQSVYLRYWETTRRRLLLL